MRSIANKNLGARVLTTLILASLTSSVAHAAAPSSEFDYPELLVTPRASDRLASEAAKESSTRWTTLLPIQISGLTTLTAGIIQVASPSASKDPDGLIGMSGVAVGGAWVVTTLAMQLMYQPYTSAHQEVSAMQGKTPRDQLTRERAAEEAIRKQARLVSRLKWLSFLSNLGAAGYMAAKSDMGSVSQITDGVAAAFAFAPLVFRSRWQDVHEEQQEYKKRIYAPIASTGLMSEPGTGRVAPGVFLTMAF